MHSNLALISRHPHAENNHACIIISPNLPRAETAGSEAAGGSMHAFEFRGCHGHVSRSMTVIFRARRAL